MSGRPAPAASVGSPVGPSTGTPATVACSMAESWSMRIRTGVSGGSRTPSGSIVGGRSEATPTDSRGTTTSPSPSESTSTARYVCRSSSPNGTATRSSSRVVQRAAVTPLQTLAPIDQGPVVLVGELLLGADATSRPDVSRGLADHARRAADPAARASSTTSARDSSGAADRVRPIRYADPMLRSNSTAMPATTAPATSSRGPIMSWTRAGTHRPNAARRAWNDPKEPTRDMDVDVIAAGSRAPSTFGSWPTVRPRRGSGLRDSSTIWGVLPSSVHDPSTSRRPSDPRHGPVTRLPRGRSAGRWSAARHPRQLSTSRPPTSSALVMTSEWPTRQTTAPMPSRATVSISLWTMTWSSRDEPSSATRGVPLSRLQRSVAGARLQGVDPEAVAHQQQPLGIPEETIGLVADDRREACRPDAQRPLDPQLGAAQSIGFSRDQRAHGR